MSIAPRRLAIRPGAVPFWLCPVLLATVLGVGGWSDSLLAAEPKDAPDEAAVANNDATSQGADSDDAASVPMPSPEESAFFEKHVRPILVEHCYSCHSAQAKELRGGLLLDSRPGWARGGDSGPAIVPGNPDESLLIQAVRYDGYQMPPAGKLKPDQIARLEEWVRLGAPDPRLQPVQRKDERTIDIAAARNYWAFRPLANAAPPPVKNNAWARNDIDRYVLARQEARGLVAAPPASPRDLVRRAYFTLLGLPPEPEVLEAFVQNHSDEAYAALLDRLLDRPEFGERWARHWLDVARFAESHGFEQDYNRDHAYHYRDFVIRAFNQDMPYDRFVAWQLAGDELAPDDPLALMATGFLGAGVFPTQITKNEVEKSRYDALDDMAATTGAAFLGLSVGCARCHDHKFDPIPTLDYYRLTSTFTTTVRSNVDLDLDPATTRAKLVAWEAEHRPLAAALEKFEAEQLPARFERWLADSGAQHRQRVETAAWIGLLPKESKSTAGAAFQQLDDGSLLVTGTNADNDHYTLTIECRSGPLRAIRLEALRHASLPQQGPGRAPNGNFGLGEFKVALQPLAGGESRELKLLNPRVTHQQNDSNLSIAASLNGDKKTGWAIDGQIGRDHAAVFEIDPASWPAEHREVRLTITMNFGVNKQHNIGRLRLAGSRRESDRLPSDVAPQPGDALSEALHAALLELAESGPRQLSPEQRQVLLADFKQQDEAWLALASPVHEHLAKKPAPTLVKVMICSEGVTPIRHHTQGADFFEQTHFLRRGDPDQKGDVVEQGFLQVLMRDADSTPGDAGDSGSGSAVPPESRWQTTPPAGSKLSYRRTALARWILDTEHGAGHLAARVIVNRLWQHHFGRGLVATPNDFGVQGQPPTHPELLDYLAGELIRNGWRLKPLHKQIMLSAAWRQSSRDADLDAEFERVSNAQAANIPPSRANLAIDPENDYLWKFRRRRLEGEAIRDSLLAVSGQLDRRLYGPGTLDENHTRRSIYFTIKRSRLIPMMQLFDAPEPTVSTGQRPSTTVAPQALLLLNNPQMRTLARGLAARAVENAVKGEAAPGNAAVVRQAYRIALCREPDADELPAAVEFLAAGEPSADGSWSEARLTVLADFCQVLLSLNEFIYVD